MTIKKEKILATALLFFAEQGYYASSTSKIAKAAGVSEALIFRHFKNKEGLLEAVLQQGEQRVKSFLIEIIAEEDPKVLIRKTLEMPFLIAVADQDFWRLQFKLKWEIKKYNNEKLKPLELSLAKAFKALAYEDPELEAAFILHFLDGISGAILRNTLSNEEAMKKFLLKKYNLL
ncbi:MAG: TetR/AcrR family transcriptional regulator [Saprospiraceae bacterium]